MGDNKNNPQNEAPELVTQANEPAPTPAASEGPVHYRVTYPHGLNLRAGHDKHSNVLRILPCDAEVIAADDPLQIGATTWLPVEGGWVDASYLEPVSEEN